VASGELVLAGVLSGTVLGPYFAACAALTIGLAVAGARLLAPDPRRDPPGPGGGPPREPEPPPWWPELGSLGPPGAPLEDALDAVEDADATHGDVRVPVPG
jgi:hypothetical protein